MATISTNTGKAAIAEKIGGLGSSGDFTYLHLGGDGTAASSADTQLGSQFTDSGLSPAEATVSTDAANVLSLVHKFTATAPKIMRESGVFSGPPVYNYTTNPTISVSDYDYMSTGNSFWGPMAAMDSNGIIYRAVEYETSGTGYVYLQKSIDKGKTWTLVESTNLMAGGAIVTFVDSDDLVHILKETGGVYQHLTSDGTTISSPTTIVSPGTGERAWNASIDPSSDDIHFFYYANSGATTINHYKYTHSTGTWASQGTFTVSAVTSVRTSSAIDANSNIWFFLPSGGNVYYRKWSGSSWDSEQTFYAGSGSTYIAAYIGPDGNGMLHFWDPAYNSFYSYFNGTSWSTPAAISGEPSSPFNFQDVGADNSGNFYFVYTAGGAGGSTIVLKYNGSSWDGGTTIFTGTASDYLGATKFVRGQKSYQVPDDGYALFINNYWWGGGAEDYQTEIWVVNATFGDPVDFGDGLVLHNKLNDNAASTVVVDSSVTGNDGAASTNTSALTSTGKINTALSFAGAASGDKYTVSHNSAYEVGTEWSLSFWFYADSFINDPDGYGDGIIMKDTSDYNAPYLWLFVWNNTFFNPARYRGIELVLNDGVNLDIDIGTNYETRDVIKTGEWTHCVFVIRSNGNHKCYINGIDETFHLKAQSTSRLFDMSLCTDPWTFGTWPDDTHGFDGKLDDVRFYNKALTADEALAVYNSGNGTEGAGSTAVMASRSSFNDIYLDTGDSATITTKITIN